MDTVTAAGDAGSGDAGRSPSETGALDAAPWTVRSFLVSVRDLSRSATFYKEVLDLHEVALEGEVAVLEGPRRMFAVLLREVSGQAVRHGQQELGPRAVSFDVESRTELDLVAQRLDAAGALVSRRPLHESEPFDVVIGRDPDGLPLVFFVYETGQPLDPDHFRHVAMHMYGIDL